MAKIFDNHYDLLSIAKFRCDINNKFYNPDELIKICNELYNKNNVIGGIINLFFMSKEEMMEELDINVDSMGSVLSMFKETTRMIQFLIKNNLIERDTKFIYSIEGCDYLKNVDELEELYNNGLRSILPVWNNKNKYGSGIRSDDDLTLEGKLLIDKAIELGIIIDVSHANEKTFYSIIRCIEEAKMKGKNPIVIASHSNSRELCDRLRNLTNEQISVLRESGCYLGLFTNGNFICQNNKELSKEMRQKIFLDLVSYVTDKLDYPVDKILLSTDDMDYHPDKSYHNSGLFSLNSLAFEMKNLLLTRYNNDDISKMMYQNSLDIYEKL